MLPESVVLGFIAGDAGGVGFGVAAGFFAASSFLAFSRSTGFRKRSGRSIVLRAKAIATTCLCLPAHNFC